ncbi:hypothetical protein M378DRAFT_1038766 [Amanita muscaria Koide BX008]|uniref:Uncharacterized protein n=1 Tax=Amanita muscaria (strain Koide BX008) TaxID=946122 RepID=A0A0C2WI06_AMAMK|nr:hypothetical protein M378DRAFT_1038766 [Amanita muscaria Koide BX008]
MIMKMSIAPEVICLSFYVNQVWGMKVSTMVHCSSFSFLSTIGIPFLIQVGLALDSCCRQPILECREERTLLELIRQPVPSTSL